MAAAHDTGGAHRAAQTRVRRDPRTDRRWRFSLPDLGRPCSQGRCYPTATRRRGRLRAQAEGDASGVVGMTRARANSGRAAKQPTAPTPDASLPLDASVLSIIANLEGLDLNGLRRDRCLRAIVNLVSRQRRKDWHLVRKGACVWIFRRREGAARQTLSPGDRADPGLASVRGLDWLGPNRRREGCIHVHQTYRYAARSAGLRSPAQGPLSRRSADAQGRHSAESRE